jgi:GNAT superfamily N-acetyltransferase
VLDDGRDECVGYCIGAPDVFRLVRNYPLYIAQVLGSPKDQEDVPLPEQLTAMQPWFVPGPGSDGEDEVKVVNGKLLAQLAYSADDLLVKGVEGKAELVQTCRAIMHIDILAPWQGKGWGFRLIQPFMAAVGDAKAGNGVDTGRGVQIGIAAENKKVVGFYEKVGFTVYPGGEKEGGNFWMVGI